MRILRNTRKNRELRTNLVANTYTPFARISSVFIRFTMRSMNDATRIQHVSVYFFFIGLFWICLFQIRLLVKLLWIGTNDTLHRNEVFFQTLSRRWMTSPFYPGPQPMFKAEIGTLRDKGPQLLLGEEIGTHQLCERIRFTKAHFVNLSTKARAPNSARTSLKVSYTVYTQDSKK